MQRQNKSRITASNWQNTNSQKYHSAHDNCFTKHTRLQILKLWFKRQTFWKLELYVKWQFLVPAMNIRNDDNEISQESFSPYL